MKRETATRNFKVRANGRSPLRTGTRNSQSGQALPLLVLVLVLAIIPATGYMVDFGFMYRARSFAQNMADAGAYAGVHEMVKRVGTGTGSQAPEGEYYLTRGAKIAGAVTVARNYLSQNGLKSMDAWTIELGEWNATSKTFTTHDAVSGSGTTFSMPVSLNSFRAGYPTTAIRVTVTYNVKFFFSQIIGRKETDVRATAIVRFGRAMDFNVLPIGLGDRQFYCYSYMQTYGTCPVGASGDECNSGAPSNTNFCLTDPYTKELRLWNENQSNTAPGFKGVLNFDWRWWSDRFVHDVDETGAKDQNDNDDDNDGQLDSSDNDDDGDSVSDVEPGPGGQKGDDADEDADRDTLRDEDDSDDDNDGMMDNVDGDDDNDGVSDVNDPSHEDYNTQGTSFELSSSRYPVGDPKNWFGRSPIIYGDTSTNEADMRSDAWSYITDGYPRSTNPSNPLDPLLLKAEQRSDVFTGVVAGSVRDSLVGATTTSYPNQNPQPGSYIGDHGPYAIIPLVDFFENQGTLGDWMIMRFALVRITQTDAQSAYVEIVNGIINARIDDTKQILYDANGNIIDTVGDNAGVYALSLVK